MNIIALFVTMIINSGGKIFDVILSSVFFFDLPVWYIYTDRTQREI